MASEEIPWFKVENLIRRIRESDDSLVEVYTRGGCVKFAMILLEIFPSGDILYDQSHALFELNGKCYDINGIAKKTEHHIPLREYGLNKMFDIMNLKYPHEDKVKPH